MGDGSGPPSRLVTFLRAAGGAWGGQAGGGLQLERPGAILSSGDGLQSRRRPPPGPNLPPEEYIPAGKGLCSLLISFRRGREELV